MSRRIGSHGQLMECWTIVHMVHFFTLSVTFLNPVLGNIDFSYTVRMHAAHSSSKKSCSSSAAETPMLLKMDNANHNRC